MYSGAWKLKCKREKLIYYGIKFEQGQVYEEGSNNGKDIS